MKSIEQKREENEREFLEKGPGLRYSTNTWIEAKDTQKGYHLTGGLGALGVGKMWFKTDDEIKQNPEYIKAPEMSCAGGFGVSE